MLVFLYVSLDLYICILIFISIHVLFMYRYSHKEEVQVRLLFLSGVFSSTCSTDNFSEYIILQILSVVVNLLFIICSKFDINFQIYVNSSWQKKFLEHVFTDYLTYILVYVVGIIIFNY